MIHVPDLAEDELVDDIADSNQNQYAIEYASIDHGDRENLIAEGFGDLWRPIEDWQVD